MISFFRFFIILVCVLPAFTSYGHSRQKALYSNYLKGVYSLQKQDAVSAQKYFEKAKKRYPESVYIRHKIASALIQQEKIEEAEKTLKEAKRIAPDNLDTYLALIFIYSYKSEDDKLEAEYQDFLEAAYRKKPDDLTITSHLAQFYFYQERAKEAIPLYKKILEKEPENLEAFFWLGYLYHETGRKEEAMQKWRDALSVDPNHAPSLNALGYTYAEKGINLSEAKVMIEKALEIEPQNGAYLDSLGWVYFQKGELERAKKYIKEALLYTEDPEIYLHLGIIYIEMGKESEGIDIYRQGLEKFPDDQGLKKELDKYEKKN